MITGMLGAAGLIAAEAYRRKSRYDLDGKVAVVTGGSRGLGFVLARELARAGCRVVIAARSVTELDKARDQIRLEGQAVHSVVADLSMKDEAKHLIDEACRVFGGVDVLVNNAGQIQVAPLASLQEQDFRAAMDLMFWGPLHTTMAAVPILEARGGGAIVNITSFGGMVAVPHLLPYVSAKFAAFGLSQGLHAELRQRGIVVTTVAPGTMRTGSHVQASFGGRAREEYGWFSLGATLPGFSTGVERAARQIVKAVQRQAPLLVIGLPARIGVRLAGVAPGFVATAAAAVNRLLPAAPPPSQARAPRSGGAVAHGLDAPGLAGAAGTLLGARAERRFQELRPT
jgi:NAD(P)-dependent dehydrogenase (short-subunit alcohol dehydrogenase family)